MTTEKAILILQEIKTYNSGIYIDAIDMAINALEIVQEMNNCESCEI